MVFGAFNIFLDLADDKLSVIVFQLKLSVNNVHSKRMSLLVVAGSPSFWLPSPMRPVLTFSQGSSHIKHIAANRHVRCEAQRSDETDFMVQDHDKASITDIPPGPSSSLSSFPFLSVAGLASIGCLEAVYLTLAKLTGVNVACPVSAGCATILSSDYASLWGLVPLSAAGIFAYGAVAVFAAIGHWRFINNRSRSEEDDRTLQRAVMAGSLLLGSTSAYLMYLLVAAFPGEVCPWCIGSAGISTAILGLVLSRVQRRDLEEGAAPGAGLVAATLLVLSLGLGVPNSSDAVTGVTELEYRQPEILTESPPGAVALAAKLKAAGAKMYGAFWCSHCYEQKQLFGKEAIGELPYVECFPDGWRQGVDMVPACKAADLEGFPTWVIGGKHLAGSQSFETLEGALDIALGETTAAE